MPTPCEEDVGLLGAGGAEAGGAESPLKRPATAVTPKKKTKTKEDAPEPSPKPKATPKAAAKGKGTVAAKTKAAPKSKPKVLNKMLKKPSSNGAPFKKPATSGSSGAKNKILELCSNGEKVCQRKAPTKKEKRRNHRFQTQRQTPMPQRRETNMWD